MNKELEKYKELNADKETVLKENVDALDAADKELFICKNS